MQEVAKSLSTGVQEGRVFLLHTTASHPKGLNYCFQAQNKSKTVVFASYEWHLDNVTTFHMFSILRTSWKALLSVISVITCCTGLHVPSSKMHTKNIHLHKKACVRIPEQSNWNNITDLLCLLHDCP